MASSAADIATAASKGADQEESGVTFDVHASAHVPSAPLVPLRLVARPQPPAGAGAARQGSGPVAKIEDVTAEGKLANPAALIVVVEENLSMHTIASGTQCALYFEYCGLNIIVGCFKFPLASCFRITFSQSCSVAQI